MLAFLKGRFRTAQLPNDCSCEGHGSALKSLTLSRKLTLPTRQFLELLP